MDDHLLPPPIGDNGGPSMGPAETPSETKLLQENREMHVKLGLAHAFTALWLRAYDALLHHGVNVRELPQYKDTALLDKGVKAPLEHGRGHIMAWIERLHSSINAAVRRKGIKPVE